MSKTKWHTKAIYLGIALVLAVGVLLMPMAAGADPGLSKWTKVATPDENSPLDNIIRQGSDITDFAVSSDGNYIYAIGNLDGTPKIWKSHDGGTTFIDKTKYLLDADDLPLGTLERLLAVAVSPDDKNFLAVAGIVAGEPVVVVSEDGCAKFSSTGFEDVAWWMQVSPRCLDISKEYGGKKAIAVGVTDPLLTEGLVYIAEIGGIGISWKDTSLKAGWVSSTAVTSLVFSPAYATDKNLVVVTTDGSDAYLQYLKWSTALKAWNNSGGFSSYCKIDDLVGMSDIALPSDYMAGSSLTRISFVLLTGVVGPTDDKVSERGEVRSRLYKIDNITASDSCGPVTSDLLGSLAYSGTIDEGKAMVALLGGVWDPITCSVTPKGCCKGLQVWRTTEITACCPTWKYSYKPPTGQLNAIVAYTSDGKRAYATSMGSGVDAFDESAFSVSLDDGLTWNQIGLIDTNVDFLGDVAAAPDCNTLYVSSTNFDMGCACDSVWRRQNEADYYAGKWQRVWCKNLTGVDEVGLLRLAEDATDGAYVVLGDQDSLKVYVSSNSGQIWGTKASDLYIQDIGIPTAQTILVLDADACVAKSTDNGWTWGGKVETKIVAGHTIAVSGDDILIGPAGGTHKVAYSSDGGATFSRTVALPTEASGDVHVAFDSKFDENETIYVAVSNAAIYRLIGLTGDWEDLNAVDHGYYGIVLGKSDDTLYAAYNGGVARILDPWKEKCCAAYSWDYMVKPDAAPKDFTLEPSSLEICGCLTASTNSVLYAIDNDWYTPYGVTPAYGHLFEYEDCFAKKGPTLISPTDGIVIPSDPCVCESDSFTVKWDRLCNACAYDIQFLNEDMSSYVLFSKVDYPDILNPASPSFLVPEGTLDCSKTYKWRIRSRIGEYDDEVRSPWSELRVISVAAGPAAAIQLTAPADSKLGVPISGVGFTWTTVAGADSYDFVLSKSADLSSPVESKTGLTGTAYACTETLENLTTYYWQVTAKKGAGVVSESSISAFTTAPKPVEPTPPVVVKEYPPPEPAPAPTTPAWVWIVIGIGAVLVIVVIVLIFRTRRV